jgi:hypothetical protein
MREFDEMCLVQESGTAKKAGREHQEKISAAAAVFTGK